MQDLASPAGWWSIILHRVRESDIERQVLYNRIRKVGVGSYLKRYVSDSVGVLLPEFLKILCGSMLGFWIITSVTAHFFHVPALYTLAAFGLLYSLQASYYKYRLSVEPGYKVPKCRCSRQAVDHTETVLRSGTSAILKIPNSVIGAMFYPAVASLVYAGYTSEAMFVAVLAVLASAYLSYVMIIRIGGLCSTCINISALNLLILWQLLR